MNGLTHKYVLEDEDGWFLTEANTITPDKNNFYIKEFDSEADALDYAENYVPFVCHWWEGCFTPKKIVKVSAVVSEETREALNKVFDTHGIKI